MTNIPDFKSTKDELEYYDIFDENVDTYNCLFKKVLETVFPNHIDDVRVYELATSIVSSISWDATSVFKKRFEGYEDDDDDIFVPRTSLKTTITEMVTELITNFKSENETEKTETEQFPN